MATYKSGWCVNIEKSQGIINKKSILLSLKIDFNLADSADPDSKKLHHA